MEGWQPVIGVVVAQFVLVALYFGKLRADDRRRWHERRLDLYLEFQGLVHELVQDLDPSSGFDSMRTPRSADELHSELDRVKRAIDKMQLICPGRVGDAATLIWVALITLWASTQETEPDQVETRQQLSDLREYGLGALNDALSEFEREVRRSLGLPRELLRETYWSIRARLRRDDQDEDEEDL